MNKPQGRPMKARPRILEAARDIFLEQGMDVSLHVIVERANTTRPTLYSHFPGGKDQLLVETFSFLNDQLQPSLQQLLNDKQHDLPALLLGIARMIQTYFFSPANIHFQRLLIQVLVQRPEIFSSLAHRPTGRIRDTLAQVLAQFMDEGKIQLDDANLQSTAFLGAIMGYSLPAALIGEVPVDQAWLDKLALSAVETFLRAWQYSSE
ncbi:TetR/AcrR family transcriptional regulator [Budviciaceae bacterium CWB-B4]|uniref:TetR/AcrR family transcriptional regulator n=1 Tax=Limnobaculum xujianqingii TaxID=2738837 RepID=A0A9D7FTY7_9GAMM|nr:TetR/AcrR family transcriptional regulator [Limnobaculum xujianqingii]MBK5073401.1 TetR/AcrR family transcriptional regulator [Limnobaculum xujianqingii]MBK5176868.1 TetR/AcrR family transcriptional regulator [Limnobaculum xujianqingii]